MFLANIGSLFATVARFVFSRGICHHVWKRRAQNHQVLTISRALASTSATQTTRNNTRENTPAPLPEVEDAKESVSHHRGMVAAHKVRLGHEDSERHDKLQMVVPKTFIFGILAFYTLAGMSTRVRDRAKSGRRILQVPCYSPGPRTGRTSKADTST